MPSIIILVFLPFTKDYHSSLYVGYFIQNKNNKCAESRWRKNINAK